MTTRDGDTSLVLFRALWCLWMDPVSPFKGAHTLGTYSSGLASLWTGMALPFLCLFLSFSTSPLWIFLSISQPPNDSPRRWQPPRLCVAEGGACPCRTPRRSTCSWPPSSCCSRHTTHAAIHCNTRLNSAPAVAHLHPSHMTHPSSSNSSFVPQMQSTSLDSSSWTSSSSLPGRGSCLFKSAVLVDGSRRFGFLPRFFGSGWTRLVWKLRLDLIPFRTGDTKLLRMDGAASRWETGFRWLLKSSWSLQWEDPKDSLTLVRTGEEPGTRVGEELGRTMRLEPASDEPLLLLICLCRASDGERIMFGLGRGSSLNTRTIPSVSSGRYWTAGSINVSFWRAMATSLMWGGRTSSLWGTDGAGASPGGPADDTADGFRGPAF